MKDDAARPPHINVTQVSPGILEVEYQSHRDMGALALGCVYGVADFYGEKATLIEQKKGPGTHRTYSVRLSAGTGIRGQQEVG